MEMNGTETVGNNTSIVTTTTPGAHDGQNSTTPGDWLNILEY